MQPLFGKTSRAIVVMGAVLALPYLSPKLRKLRIAQAPWDHTVEVAAPASAEKLDVGEATLSASKNQGTVNNALPETAKPVEVDPSVLAKAAGSLAVEDETGHAMDAFYTHLAATLRKDAGAVTRILHYGDSLITSDFISGTMRRKMQGTFGDAGHGFILIANAWDWYFHNDVSHSASEGWSMSRITGPLTGDGMYGLGGVSFRASGAASATFATKDKGEFGTKASRFDLYYLEQPGGGGVGLYAKGLPPETLSTQGPKKVSRVHSITVPDGAAQLTVKAWGEGARLFGVALERDVPGVVYDALGANGARVKLLEGMSADHWSEQLALRKPALVVLQYGTNETAWGFDENYEKVLAGIVERVKAGAPDASILILAPLDRAERAAGGFKTMPVIPKLVNAQKNVAREQKIAFWNTFEAMGGEGSMGKWVKANPQLAGWDLTHPTPEGAELIGGMLYAALIAGYQAYASTHEGAPKLP
jgi:lysophospholipase L1-like esterase